MAARKAAPTGHQFSFQGHDFELVQEPPMGALLLYVRREQLGDGLLGMDALMLTWLPPAQHAAWDVALSGVKRYADLTVCVQGVIDAVTARPTRASSS